jgi:hypothetical protein
MKTQIDSVRLSPLKVPGKMHAGRFKRKRLCAPTVTWAAMEDAPACARAEVIATGVSSDLSAAVGLDQPCSPDSKLQAVNKQSDDPLHCRVVGLQVKPQPLGLQVDWALLTAGQENPHCEQLSGSVVRLLHALVHQV